jgi:hypothetical protein
MDAVNPTIPTGSPRPAPRTSSGTTSRCRRRPWTRERSAVPDRRPLLGLRPPRHRARPAAALDHGRPQRHRLGVADARHAPAARPAADRGRLPGGRPVAHPRRSDRRLPRLLGHQRPDPERLSAHDERRYQTVDPLTISLQGQTAVVTGASSGIGAEITVTLARCGAQVIGVGRDPTIGSIFVVDGGIDARSSLNPPFRV